MRPVSCLALALAALMLAACGRVGPLNPPEGSVYPRSYPEGARQHPVPSREQTMPTPPVPDTHQQPRPAY
ncbi:lipoprotein [Telmatospirillum sp. J64-1]|uniref:lipoprotein n=1 Tax=Telmatospirillum sp. J64-1 TaxID=2502183 RepID=UPI00115DAF77|nr:lipoprotein [Telmatospirillum sp. J64-1]